MMANVYDMMSKWGSEEKVHDEPVRTKRRQIFKVKSIYATRKHRNLQTRVRARAWLKHGRVDYSIEQLL
jgi:hypothetical protein